MNHHYLIRCGVAIAALVGLSIHPVVLATNTPDEPDPTVVQANIGDKIPAQRLPDNVYLRDVNDPDDIIWEWIPSYRVSLDPAPAVHESVSLRAGNASKTHVNVQLARTSERFYVRLRWNDTTENRQNTVDRFSDGAAVQFALNGEDTSYMMGTNQDQPVNIWYWQAAGDQVQNLAAGGFGSTTTLPEQVVSGKSAYHEDDHGSNRRWSVVMSRELDSPGQYHAVLNKGVIPVSFALWQGEDGQRDGLKQVSLGWVMVDVAPH